MSKNNWGFNCFACPGPVHLPLYIKNASLFSGVTNNPGFMSTQVMICARRANTTAFSLRRETRIVQVPQRVIAVLSNPSGTSQARGSI